MKYSNLKEERKLWRKGYKGVVGLDEAGRGPLAGPVIAAAVMVNSDYISLIQKQFKNLKLKIKNLQFRDSKKLSLRQREQFYMVITKSLYVEWGIGQVSEKVIDRINILEATKLAMTRAIAKLKTKNKKRKIDFLILDGNFKIDLPIPQKSIIKADEKVFSCTAAGIIAKVTRDRIMKREYKKYPQYGFDKHKGYPTKLHRKMLKKHGFCQIHRKSFRPIKKYVIIK